MFNIQCGCVAGHSFFLDRASPESVCSPFYGCNVMYLYVTYFFQRNIVGPYLILIYREWVQFGNGFDQF